MINKLFKLFKGILSNMFYIKDLKKQNIAK